MVNDKQQEKIMKYPSSKRKKFNPALYRKADPLAKECISKYLMSLGHEVTIPKENYGVDILSNPPLPHLNHPNHPPVTEHHEVEMKFMWEGEWPKGWRNVNIPFRKARLIDMVYNKDENARFFFYIIRKDCKQAWKMDGRVVQASPVVEVPNRAVPKGEYFYKVPLDKAELINIGD